MSNRTKQKRFDSRSMRFWVAALAVLVACGAATHSGTGIARGDAIVVFRSNVRDAQVYVDGRFVAPLDAIAGGVALAPGTHRFELRHDEFFSSYLELTLARAERKNISLELAPILP